MGKTNRQLSKEQTKKLNAAIIKNSLGRSPAIDKIKVEVKDEPLVKIDNDKLKRFIKFRKQGKTLKKSMQLSN